MTPSPVSPLPPLPDRPLSVCIVGAGAIGGMIAAHLATAGPEAGIGPVSVIARGAHLAAIRDHGLRLTTPSAEVTARVTALEDPDDLPPQDLVICALKGHQVSAMAEKLSRLLAPHGRLMAVVNGIPWWYPIADGQGGLRGAEEVDPGGRLWQLIGPERAIGCVAKIGASVPEPGQVSVTIPGFYEIGRLPGQDRADVDRVAALFTAAGIVTKMPEPFQNAIWGKLLGNAALNSVCALARTEICNMAQHPVLSKFSLAIMEEVHATAHAEQADTGLTPAERMAEAAAAKPFRPSTLQDLEKGRPMEIEPIFGATIAVAKSHGIPCPNLELATALLRSIDRALHG